MPIKLSVPTLCLLLTVVGFVYSQSSPVVPTLDHQFLQNILDELENHMFTAANPPSAFAIRKHLRAMFHDCTQGCDGSINLGNTDNRGLESYVRRMRRLYRDTPIFHDNLSKADFAILCGRRALAHAINDGGANSGSIPNLAQGFSVFNYGRPNTTQDWDADTNEGPFPDGIANWTNQANPADTTTILGSVQSSLKGMISEAELVALLGIHNLGAAVQLNSGFAGPWGASADRDRLTNGLYGFISGSGRGPNFDLIQTSSGDHANGASIEPNYQSPPPTTNKLQWTRVGASAQGRIMLNADMGFYHEFTADSVGAVTGKFCNQRNNATLFDCHATDPTYLPLSPNAGQVRNYVLSQNTYYTDVINAFLKMTSVPGDNDSGVYTDMSPEWKCVNGALVCQGDVFMQGCPGFTQPACP